MLLVGLFLVMGCQPQEPLNGSANVQPDRAEVFELLESAQKKENVFYEGRYTREEVFAYFESSYTEDYIQTMILEGGNMKFKDGHWVLAHIGSEFIEGTYSSGDFDETTRVDYPNDTTIIVSHEYGDGLYPPHVEHITFVKTEAGWLVDTLEWEWTANPPHETDS